MKKLIRTALTALTMGLSANAMAADSVGWPEKADLKFGFIKLTDMAPLAVAYEKGYFEEEGLSSLWKPRPTGKCCWTG